MLGEIEGAAVGKVLGIIDGPVLGAKVGVRLGDTEVGIMEGRKEGIELGSSDGAPVCAVEGL